ncbi:MAG: RCC1 domain-containing protein, partial [Gemmatimonadales bacterium]
YCWGSNTQGQLGTSAVRVSKSSPAAVMGGLSIRDIESGELYTCAVTTTTNRAYCWGMGASGQLGDGTQTTRVTPGPVSGSIQFKSVSAYSFYSCGISMTGNGYCWGASAQGNLGDGTINNHLTPTPVAGNITFLQISAGEAHACGASSTGRGYCWGDNHAGRLGDGGTSRQLAPVPVSGS